MLCNTKKINKSPTFPVEVVLHNMKPKVMGRALISFEIVEGIT